MKTTITKTLCTIILFLFIGNLSKAQNWSIKGNISTNVATNFLGTKDNIGLSLRTHNIERVRITSLGKIGIGTTTPQQQLDVNGSINLATDSAIYFGNIRMLRTTQTGLALGYIALSKLNANSGNVAVGPYTMPSLATGNDNTALGNGALNSLHDGYDNTAVGGSALILSTSGYGNTAVGYFAATGETTSNSMALGYHAIATESNQVRVGDVDVTSIGGAVDWSTMSDGRVKKNIKANVPGLSFIKKLKPITYNLDLNTADKILGNSFKASNSTKIDLDAVAKQSKEAVIYTGFIAQDVEQAARSLQYDFSGVDAAKNTNSLYGLRYSQFVVPIVKAVQELSLMNDAKDSTINVMKSQIQVLQDQMNEIKLLVSSSSSNNTQKSSISLAAHLSQNSPNPFPNTTTISYSFPKNYSSAYIVITDFNGKTLKQINLNSATSGSIDFDGSSIASGAYHYSLVADQKILFTKTMQHIK